MEHFSHPLKVAAVVAVLVAACTSGATPRPSPAGTTAATPASTPAVTAAPTPTPSPVAVTVQLGFKYAVVQWYSIYHLGANKGFWAKYGIIPTFVEGTGSAASIQLVANGNADFGAAISTSVVMQAVGQGAAVKMVAQETPVSTIAVLSRSDVPINKPTDLAGKKIGYDPASYAGQLFAALLAANNIAASSVQIVTVSGGNYATSLAAKQIDGYVSAPDTNVDTLKSIGVTPVVMNFRDFGVDPKPQEGIVVNANMIKTKPDVIKRFVAGLNDLVNYLITTSGAAKEAADAGVAAKPDVIKADIAQSQVQYHIDFVKSGVAAGKSPLLMSDAAFQALETLLQKYSSLPSPQPVSAYYTNDYVPQ